MDFLEYVAALNLVLRGKLEHKLKGLVSSGGCVCREGRTEDQSRGSDGWESKK